MTAQRDGAGRFLAGTCGNPRGRPRGARNKRHAAPDLQGLLRECAAKEAGAIIAALVTATRAGDAQAAAVLLAACQAQGRP